VTTGEDRPRSALPIPADAEILYAGDVFEVLRWRQELFDGSVRFFEKVRRRDTALVLPVIDGVVRITRQEQPGHLEPFFALIGGRVDPGEAPEAAARRELREEAALVPSSLELWTSLQPFAKIEWAVYLYVARGCAMAGDRTSDPGERIELVDVSLDELISIAGGDAFRDVGVALHLLRLAVDPSRLARARLYLLGSPDGA
jgi:8-oxo-dGTP pyrophosphatase MutT (NUDIX family)